MKVKRNNYGDLSKAGYTAFDVPVASYSQIKGVSASVRVT